MIEFIWPQGCELNPERAEIIIENDDEYFADAKISGERLSITMALDGITHLFSRSPGKNDLTRPIELTYRWPSLVNKLNALMRECPEYKGTILDGEAYSPLIREAEIPGWLNSKNTEPLPDHFVFIGFDIVYRRDRSLEEVALDSRRDKLREFIQEFQGFCDNVLFMDCPMKLIVSSDYPVKMPMKKFIGDILAAGGEGGVIKNRCSGYYQDKKPAGIWTKYKKSDTFDCFIMGFKPGAKKYLGKVGSIILGQYPEGSDKPFEVCCSSGFNDAVRDVISANPDAYLGMVVVVDAYERSHYGKLIQPRIKRFRGEGEKSAKECTFKWSK